MKSKRRRNHTICQAKNTKTSVPHVRSPIGTALFHESLVRNSFSHSRASCGLWTPLRYSVFLVKSNCKSNSTCKCLQSENVVWDKKLGLMRERVQIYGIYTYSLFRVHSVTVKGLVPSVLKRDLVFELFGRFYFS